MWVPLEKVSGGGSNACVASSPGCISGGSSVGAKYAFWASCAIVIDDADAPRTQIAPSTSSRSSSGASRRYAAMRTSLSFKTRAAPSAAPTLTTPPRAPRVPMPYGAAAVSPDWTRIFSIGTVSSSASAWATVVRWPWPCPTMPIWAVTTPLGSIRTIAASSRVVEDRERALEGVARIDRAIDHLGRGRVRQVRLGEHVAAPDLDRI